jgi:phosphoribosylanthranilate isomerase
VRQITEQLSPEILTIGVFVNEPSPELVRIALAEAGVTGVQLHGDESPEYCATLADKFVIKVVRGRNGCTDLEHAEQYDTSALMIDTFDPLERGGTGRLSDWSFARRLSSLTPKLFLAGGLSPENVAAGIKNVAPYAVDACTALESSPGRKDLKRVRAFIEAVQQVR